MSCRPAGGKGKTGALVGHDAQLDSRRPRTFNPDGEPSSSRIWQASAILRCTARSRSYPIAAPHLVPD